MTSYLGTRLIEIEGGLVADLLDQDQPGRAHLPDRAAHRPAEGQAPAAYLDLPGHLGCRLGRSSCSSSWPRTSGPRPSPATRSARPAAATFRTRRDDDDAWAMKSGRSSSSRACSTRRPWYGAAGCHGSAQLFMSLPHATNRYLNLLAFFARVTPEEINAWRATLAPDTARRLNAVLDASANRRPPRRHPSLLSTSLALLVTGGVLAASGWFFFGHLASARAAQAAAAGTAQLRPGRLRRAPAPRSPVPANAAAQAWTPRPNASRTRSAAGDRWSTVHFRTQGAMQAVFDQAAQGVSPARNCSPRPGQNTYTLASSSQTAGHFVCENGSGQPVLAWTDNDLDILSVATSGATPRFRACTSGRRRSPTQGPTRART